MFKCKKCRQNTALQYPWYPKTNGIIMGEQDLCAVCDKKKIEAEDWS